MSKASKVFFTCSVLLSGGTIWGVHYIQQQERVTMFQGVLKDDARLAQKRIQKAREEEFAEQARKRAYLEDMQGVSSSTSSTKLERERIPIPTKEEMKDVEFGCTTCDRVV